MKQSSNTLFVCYGNDFIGNDAFGKAVYEALPYATNKLFSHQLLPELLENAMGCDTIVFVDATIGKGEVELYEIESTIESTSNFHHLTPQVFLSLLASIYSKTPRAFVCTAHFEEIVLGSMDADFDEKVSMATTLLGSLQS